MAEHKQGNLSKKAFDGTIIELFNAAAFTVADTLDWSILYLSMDQEVQETAFQELKNKLGSSSPTMAMQQDFPYLDGICKETLRIRPPSPLLLMHIAENDGVVAGYPVKKGTIVVSNVFGIGNSEKFYENSQQYNPSRWLEKSNKSNSAKAENLLNFGVGPTMCPGMVLAKQELFLAISTILHRYHFQLSPKNLNPSLRGEFGVLFKPAEWYSIVFRRKL